LPRPERPARPQILLRQLLIRRQKPGHSPHRPLRNPLIPPHPQNPNVREQNDQPHTHVNQQLRLPMARGREDDLPATRHQRPQNRLHPPLLKRRRQIRATPRSPKPPATKRQKMLQQRRDMLDRQIPMRLRERTLSPQPVPSPLNLPLIPNPRIPASNRRPINPKPLRTLLRRTKRLLIPTLSKKRRRRLPHLTISRLPNPSLPPSPSQNLRPPMSHTQIRTQRKDRVPTPLTIRLDRITPTIQLTHNPSPPSKPPPPQKMEPDPTKEEPTRRRGGEERGPAPNPTKNPTTPQ